MIDTITLVASGDLSGCVIVSGMPGAGKSTDEALRQDELCNRNMSSLANNFINFGFTVLMDSVLVDQPELDFFLALLSPRPATPPGGSTPQH